eukprot:1420368-Lingulodinium_polyedra.AAC.1
MAAGSTMSQARQFGEAVQFMSLRTSASIRRRCRCGLEPGQGEAAGGLLQILPGLPYRSAVQAQEHAVRAPIRHSR